MTKDQDNPSHEQAVYALMMATRKFTRATLLFQHTVSEKMHLNVTDAECIDFLMEMGPSTAGELASATRLTTGAVTSMIDRLEKAGFVKREKDPTDRRKVIVTFVPDKHEKASVYYTPMAMDVFRLYAGYSIRELQLLQRNTEALMRIYQDHAEKCLADRS